MQDTTVDGTLLNILREATHTPELRVDPGTALRDIPGWDSVSMVAAMLSIEDEFAIEFQSNEFATLTTINDLTDLIARARG